MSNEVQALILKQLDEIKRESSEQHALILNRMDLIDDDIVSVREQIVTRTKQIDDDVVEVRERLIKLEVQERQLRWIFAGAGGILLLGAKELVVWFMREVMPDAQEALMLSIKHLFG